MPDNVLNVLLDQESLSVSAPSLVCDELLQVADLDLSVDGVDRPAHELLVPDFELSKLLAIIAFALDLGESEDRGFFEELGITPRQELVKKIGAVIQFEVKSKSGQKEIFTADMKKSGRIVKGKIDGLKPDTMVACSDADLVSLAKGQQSPQKAFLTGRLKVKGKLMVGLRMQDVLQAELGKMSKL